MVEGEETLGAQRSEKYNLKARQLQLTIAQKTQKTGLFTESARCKEVFWLKNRVSGHPYVQGYKFEVRDIDEPALQIMTN